MTMRDRNDGTAVLLVGAGLVPWSVLSWLRAAERLGVQFRVVDDCVEHKPILPPSSLRFLATHADAVRRVVLATPTRLM